jgi:DNA-binding GntR family transcriptional regulator
VGAVGLALRNPRPGESSYRLLTQSLRQDIFLDHYAEDEPLPTDFALAAKHGLSRQTVRRAYQELVAEGLVYRVPGRGTFVTPKHTRYRRPFGTVDDLMNLQLDTEFELVEPISGTVDEVAAQALQLPENHVFALAFRRRHRGEAFCLTRVFLPPRIAQRLSDVSELTRPGIRTNVTVIALIESHGNDIAEAEQVITAVAATSEIAALLGCDEGLPLLHVERTYIDRKGEPLEYAVSDFLPDHYSHRLRLGRGAAPQRLDAPR